MGFDVFHGPPAFLTGINALRVGRDQEERRVTDQNIANDLQVAELNRRSIDRLTQNVFSLRTQNFQAEQAQERIRLREQLRTEAQSQSTRERFISQQVQQRNKLLQMPPYAAAEIYSNVQEIARITSDRSLPEDDQRQMVDILAAQNEAIYKANPPPQPPTITDDMESGQIKIDRDNGLVFLRTPKGLTVRTLKRSVTVKEFAELVEAEIARLRLDDKELTYKDARVTAQISTNKLIKAYRENSATDLTGDTDKDLLSQVEPKGAAAAPTEQGAPADAPTPETPRQRAAMEGIRRAITDLDQLVQSMDGQLGVDQARNVGSWSDAALAHGAPIAQRIERFTMMRFPTMASLSDLTKPEKDQMVAILEFAKKIIDEANKRAQQGITIDEQNPNR